MHHAPRHDADDVAGADARRGDFAARAFLGERDAALAGGVIDDLDFFEREDVRGTENDRIDAQREAVAARDGGVLNRGANETAHHRGILMLSISRVLPTRTAPTTRRSRSKSD